MSHLMEIHKFLPEELVNKDERKKLRTLLGKLPPLSGAIIESRLGAGQQETDFSLCVGDSDGGQEIVANETNCYCLPNNFSKKKLWSNIVNYCKAWKNNEDNRYRQIKNIWLEFDSKKFQNIIPHPSVFINFKVEAVNNSNDQIIKISKLLNKLTGDRLSKATMESLIFCIKNIPDNTQLHSIGSMQGREKKIIRLNLLVSFKEVIPYLKKINMQNSIEELQTYKGFLKSNDRVVLGLDLFDSILPKIGLEVKPSSPEHMSLLLTELVIKNLCTPEKKQAIENWTDISQFEANINKGRLVTINPVTALNHEVQKINIKRVNHFKLTFESNKKTVAKVYLYTCFAWVKQIF